MKRADNNKWLDDLLSEAVSSEKSESNFEKWQQAHRQAVEMLTSRARRGHSASKRPLNIRNIIMKSPITKLTAAAAIIIAVVLSITFLDKSIPTASAAEVFAEAAKAMANLRSVYVKLQMRTIPRDNFELIGLDYNFVPIEMWKQFDDQGPGKWRIEKSQRVVVMDGQSSLLLIHVEHATYAAKGGINPGFVVWLKPLLNVDKVLDSEIELAQQRNSELLLTHEKGSDGKDKLVVAVEALAQGDFTNDWLKNKSIPESDNLRIYTFDAETKLLEGLEVYVHTEEEDVLVLEITDIEYNPQINSGLFTLEIPQNVIWLEKAKQLPDKEKYQQMTPQQVARALLQACADKDWDEFLKYWPASAVDQRLKDAFGGLEIITIGEPFKSGTYPGWFVPYEIKFKGGYIKKMNLAVRKDKTANRYIVTGGL